MSGVEGAVLAMWILQVQSGYCGIHLGALRLPTLDQMNAVTPKMCYGASLTALINTNRTSGQSLSWTLQLRTFLGLKCCYVL